MSTGHDSSRDRVILEGIEVDRETARIAGRRMGRMIGRTVRALLVGVIGIIILLISLHLTLDLPSRFATWTAVILSPALVVVPLLHWSRHRRLLRRVMRERGFEVCVPCGYDLRHLPASVPRCPECGASREPLDTSGRQGANNHL